MSFSLLLMLALLDGPMVVDGTIGGDDLFIGAGASVAVRDDGTVFLLDPASFQVRVFDGDLKPIRQFGRKGKGPGEFEEPKIITLTPKGLPGVLDPTLKRLTIFNDDGSVSRSVRLDAASVAMYHPVVLNGDNTAFLSARSHQGKPVYDLNIFNKDAATVKNIVREAVEPLDWSRSNDPSFWVDFLVNELNLISKGLPVLTRIDGDTFVYAKTNDYQLHFVDAQGTAKKTVTRKLKPLALTDANKMAVYEAVWNRLTIDPFLFNNMPRKIFERAADRAEAPPALPLIKTMAPYGGGFVVLTQYDDAKQKGKLDLFSKDGAYQSTQAFSGPADAITGNRTHLFVTGPNAEGDITVKRLRLQ